MNLDNSFTGGRLDRRNFVYYMVHTLVKDSFLTVKQVIGKHIVDGEDRKKMKDLIPFVDESLNYFAVMHIGKDNNLLHDVEYSVHQEAGKVRMSNCGACLKSFQFRRDVNARIPETLKDPHVDLSEAIKTELLLLHQMQKFFSG